MRIQLLRLIPFLCCLLALGCGDDGGSADVPVDSPRSAPRLTHLEFLAADNPELLVDDAVCDIVGDSVVECWVAHVMSGKRLVARFGVEDEDVSPSTSEPASTAQVLVDGTRLESGVTAVDFTRPVTLTVTSGADRLYQRSYTVVVHAFTGLPVLWIETEDRAPVESKEEYITARFRLAEDVATRSSGDVMEMTGLIRGRGNTTWKLMPKKSYRLKLDEKASLLGEPADRSWVLLANYADKTMLRNATALRMGYMSNLDYTPRSHFVEVIFNGHYDGTYQLCEHLKVAHHRVDVGDDGFLMEIDSRATTEADSVKIKVGHIASPICIKDPDVALDSEAYRFAARFLAKADSALFSDGFTDPETGWRRYLDMDSFVDWYLVNEIARNNDAVFFSSCFMNLRRDGTAEGGTLCMGPLWDFDIAFGNVNYNDNYEPEGFWIKTVPWYARLMQDPAFAARVRERFAWFYDHRNDILDGINQDARYLRRAVEENENRWGTFYEIIWQNHDVWGNYQNEVQYMKSWFISRMDWLRNQF